MKLLFTPLSIFLLIIFFSFSGINLIAQQVINVAAGADLNAVKNNVRSLNDNMSEDIIVNLAGGNYFLTSTLNFDSADGATNGHRIIWKNANNERPVISGGVEITGWQNEGSGQGIIYASVPNGFRFRQLYVNNAKAKRATYLEDTWARGTFQASQKRFVINRNVGQNASIFDSLIEWNQIGNVEVNNVSTFVMRQTKIDRIELVSTDVIHVYIADPAAATLQNQNPPNYVYDIYFENAFEFIDEQGEWYLDEAANIVYYKRRTGETAGNVEVMAPAVERLIDIQNTNGLTFFGLTFQHSTWIYPSDGGFLGFQNMYVSQAGNLEIPAAIHIESSDKIQFERNVIRHTGGTGMMAFDNSLTDLNLIGNVFYETAAGGLQLGNDDKKGPRVGSEGLYQAVVQNNYFYNVGFEYSATVIFGTFPYQLDFKHNEMVNSLAMGLNLGWGWDSPDDLFYRPIVKYNKFQSICQVGTDASVYHTRNRSRGALISENWFDNTVKVVNLRRLGRFTNTVNDPKFGNLYLDNDALDNNFVRNAHTNFSDNGYGPQLQNKIHIFGASSSPNYIVDDLGASTVTQNNAGLTAEYADIVNYLNAGSIGGNNSPSDHVKAAYLVDDRDPVVTYTGSWTTESSGGVNRDNGGYLNTYTSTTVNGAELSLSFTGDGIEFIAPTNATQATVQIFIDNVLQTTLDLSGSDSYQDIQYTKSGLNTGPHTLRIIKTGGTKLQIDAFQVNQGTASSAVITTELFEDYEGLSGLPVSHSVILGAGNTADIQSFGNCGNHKLFINDASSSGSGQTIIDFSDIDGTAYVSFDITPNQTNSSIHFDLRSAGSPAVKVSIGSDGNIRYYEQGNNQVLQSYIADTIYRFQIVADNLTKKYSLEVNGNLVQNLDFNNTSLGSLDNLRVFSLGSSVGSLEFDNLIIKNEPIEPSEYFDIEDCLPGAYDYESSLTVPSSHIVTAPTGSSVGVVYSAICDNNSLVIDDNSSSSSTQVEIPFEGTSDIIEVQFTVEAGQTNSSTHFIISDNSNLAVIRAGLISNGKIRYYQNGGFTNWIDYDADTEYSIRIRANNSTKKYTLIVNGNQVEDLDFSNSSGGAISKFNIVSLGASVGEVRIDNVVLANEELNDLVFPSTVCAENCATFTTIEAEAYDDMLGVVVGNSGEGGQKILTTNGDWARYNNIDLTCASSISARVASLTSGGDIEVRLDGVSGTLIGTLSVGNTGSWQTWTTVSGNINSVTGVHDVYLVFTGGSGLLINLTWFEFSQSAAIAAKASIKSIDDELIDDKYTFVIYPNPSKNRLTIQLDKPNVKPIIISDLNGRVIDRIVNTTDLKIEVDVSHIPAGMYLLIFENQQGRFSRKIAIMK